MIDEFSAGYYHVSMDVQRYSEGPVIQTDLHDFIQSEVFDDTDTRIMMRVGLTDSALFGVRPEGAVPRDVLALPPFLFDEQGEHEVFILKPEYANVFSDY